AAGAVLQLQRQLILRLARREQRRERRRAVDGLRVRLDDDVARLNAGAARGAVRIDRRDDRALDVGDVDRAQPDRRGHQRRRAIELRDRVRDRLRVVDRQLDDVRLGAAGRQERQDHAAPVEVRRDAHRCRALGVEGLRRSRTWYLPILSGILFTGAHHFPAGERPMRADTHSAAVAATTSVRTSSVAWACQPGPSARDDIQMYGIAVVAQTRIAKSVIGARTFIACRAWVDDAEPAADAASSGTCSITVGAILIGAVASSPSSAARTTVTSSPATAGAATRTSVVCCSSTIVLSAVADDARDNGAGAAASST